MQTKPGTAFLLGMLTMAIIAYPSARRSAMEFASFAKEAGTRILERANDPQPVIVVSPEP